MVKVIAVMAGFLHCYCLNIWVVGVCVVVRVDIAHEINGTGGSHWTPPLHEVVSENNNSLGIDWMDTQPAMTHLN